MAQIAGLMMHLAAVADPAALQPAAPWVVEYATNMCVLSRGFGGTAQAPVISLALRPLPLSTRGEMVLMMPAARTEQPSRGKIKVTLLPSGEQQQVPFDRRRDAKTQRSVVSFDVSTAFLLSMQGAEAIDVSVDREPPVRLATGSTTKALAALTPCQDDLLRTWGYDPEIKQRISKPASLISGSLAALFGRDYYPSEAVRAEQQGRTTVAWMIGPDGKTKDCRILASSGTRSLDLVTCAVILQKARYRPALDSNGQPMASYEVSSVRWAIDA